MQPCLLAIDTSTERMALSLSWPGGCLTRNEDGAVAASGRLLPLAAQMVRQSGLSFGQLDAIAFGAGPGAFTGLRIACAVAQGLALAHGRPVLPLDSLMLVAEDAAAQWPSLRRLPELAHLPSSAGSVSASPVSTNHVGNNPVWVAMDARMNEVYAASYAWQGEHWQVLVSPALYTLSGLSQCWTAQPPVMVVGSAVSAFAGRLPWAGAQQIAAEQDRAAALAALATQAWNQGLRTDPGQALPLYLRDKVALTTQERTQERHQERIQARGQVSDGDFAGELDRATARVSARV